MAQRRLRLLKRKTADKIGREVRYLRTKLEESVIKIADLQAKSKKDDKETAKRLEALEEAGIAQGESSGQANLYLFVPL